MILREAALVLGVGCGWIAVAPTRKVTRWVALWQALAAAVALGLHLHARVAWELGVRRPVYLASVPRGVTLDRGIALWLCASLLCVALAALRWRPTPAPTLLRAASGATAAMLATAAWWLRDA